MTYLATLDAVRMETMLAKMPMQLQKCIVPVGRVP